MSKFTVETECSGCGGSGLYCGFAEPKGTAVVCVTCGGSGCQTITYTPFVKRHGKRGVTTVLLSRGTFVGTGVGPAGNSVTYAEFQAGRIPKLS